MQLELNELDRRYEGLRIAEPGRQARLGAALAREGQQSPVLVVQDSGCWVLVDGYRRVAALEQLGHDLVEAVALPLEEAEALVEVWRLEAGRRRSALEDGWLLWELMDRHGRSQGELCPLFRRSKSWVSRRLGLVRWLPESVQEAVRSGDVPPHAAMKFLVPLARANSDHCERLVAAVGKVTVRQLQRLYSAWRQGDDETRERIVTHPHLFLKADEAVADQDVADEGLNLARDLEILAAVAARVRRKLRDGVLARTRGARRLAITRTWREVDLIVDVLTELFDKEKRRAGSGDQDRDPAPEA